ncbi:MAG: type III pantothenate kinase [Chitinophagaceae bacterium]|nr:MAG: type III pantothenate kinase [Chitinophagaceae bacterium]
MSITCCFDFGNTRKKCAVFNDRNMTDLVVMDDDSETAVQKVLDQFRPQRSILSSVVNHDKGIEVLLAAETRFHKLDHNSRLPVTTPVGKPETIGADRLGLVVAAADLFPGKNNLVIGLGSAITYNFINKFNEFLGGGISPGLEMRFKSLNTFTDLLPLVKKDWNFPLVGHDTRTNILSGVVLGMAKEIDGIIATYEEKYVNFNAVLTGGDTAFFVHHLKKKIFADPNLIYKGLYAICEYNNV